MGLKKVEVNEFEKFDVEKVTNVFVDLYIEYGIESKITNIVAQKLNYLANGCWLALTGNRLVKEDFEAWDYGPVIPSLYTKLKM